MEPCFLVCTKCHNGRVWNYKSNNLDCPHGCEARYSQLWNRGFGPDTAPVPRHPSTKFGDVPPFPDYGIPPLHVNNIVEMRELCR